MKIGVLYSRIRVEEKWLFEALEKRGVDYDRLDDREVVFDLSDPEPLASIQRSIGTQPLLYPRSLCGAGAEPLGNTHRKQRSRFRYLWG